LDAHGDPPAESIERVPVDLESFFIRPRETLVRPVGPVRLLGGLPDPALFPRTRWIRHYRAALAAVPDAELTYPDAFGATALRVALRGYLGRVRGVDTEPERILVCSGVTQGLTLVCRALRRAGARRIAVEDPCFALHRQAIAMTGLEVEPVPCDADGLDPSALGDVDAVLVTPAHSYPRGATLGSARRHALLAWARRRQALIIEDDYDAELRYDRTPIGALQGHAPQHVVHIGSASKTLSPALRLGWVAAPVSLIDAVVREKHYDDMGSSLLEQLAFARFVESGDLARFLRHVRPIYRDRRDATIAALGELMPTVRWHGEAAGLHLHVTLERDVDELELASAAKERGILLESASWHWARPGQAPPSIVLGYGTLPVPAIRRVVSLLADAMRRAS
jgi:GntR family transcriptional regulator / MocR family aminotransferase